MAADSGAADQSHKTHRARQSGSSAKKKKSKSDKNNQDKKQNPKVLFVFFSLTTLSACDISGWIEINVFLFS